MASKVAIWFDTRELIVDQREHIAQRCIEEQLRQRERDDDGQARDAKGGAHLDEPSVSSIIARPRVHLSRLQSIPIPAPRPCR